MTAERDVRMERAGGVPVIVVSGVVDRELAGRIEALLQVQLVETEGPAAIDVGGVEAVNGALLGVLLRASRRLSWRNRTLQVVCADPDKRIRLEIAGLDEFASLRETWPSARFRPALTRPARPGPSTRRPGSCSSP